MLSFLALPAFVAYAAVATVAAIIGLLFLIRPARIRVTVSSTMLWERVLRQAGTHRRRRRWLLSLLLSLLLGLILAFAATRPRFGASVQRFVVVLDNTVSMGARTGDGRTRWQRALADADDLIRQWGGATEVLVLDTAGREAPTGFVPARAAREQLTRMRLSAHGEGTVPALPSGDAIRGAYLFTDGVGVSEVPSGVTVRSVFERADNVAITGFEARPVPGAPTRYEAFLQIANTGTSARQVALEVRGSGGFHVARELRVDGETAINLALDVTHVDQGPLRAHITVPGDAFDLDNSAFCVVLPHRLRRVLLATPGNPPLEDSLRLLPGIALTVRSPAGHLASPGFDAYVFDRHAPSEAPEAGALFLRPPQTPWLDATWRAGGRQTTLVPDDDHPLAGRVAWGDVRIDATRLASAPEGRAVVRAGGNVGDGRAVVVSGRARARWAATGFALEDSNLPLQAGFPVFLDTALRWLDPGPTLVSGSVGWVELPLPDVEVLDGTGARVASTRTANGTLFEAPYPGVYRIVGGTEPTAIVVNANDLRMAQINRQRLAVGPAGREAAVRGSVAWPEPGIVLLGIALVLLVAEWVAFVRGATE
jgi:hypothetical protein